jgi:hypothetical protein
MSRDLRKYRRQTTIQLVIAGILLLFVVGGGLIFLIYGPSAGMTSLLCLAVGMVPILLIGGALWLMDWIVKRNRDRS